MSAWRSTRAWNAVASPPAADLSRSLSSGSTPTFSAKKPVSSTLRSFVLFRVDQRYLPATTTFFGNGASRRHVYGWDILSNATKNSGGETIFTVGYRVQNSRPSGVSCLIKYVKCRSFQVTRKLAPPAAAKSTSGSSSESRGNLRTAGGLAICSRRDSISATKASNSCP